MRQPCTVTLSTCISYQSTLSTSRLEAMEALFRIPSLQALLPSLAIKTPPQQIQPRESQKKMRNSTQHLMLTFGKMITKAHAQQLMKQSISFESLEKWKTDTKDRRTFINLLKKKKVNSKILRERLSQFFFKC